MTILHNSYQTLHFFVGFILDLCGHLKSLENSFELLNGPIIRNLATEWAPVVMRSLISSEIVK